MVKKVSIVLIAIMLGVSNAILEEDRTLSDTSSYVTRTELPADDDHLSIDKRSS